MYTAKRPLIIILVFAVVFKVLIFLGVVTKVMSTPTLFVSYSVSSGIYLLVKMFGIISALKGHPLGLKYFSIIQTLLAVMSMIYLAIVANQFIFHTATTTHQKDNIPSTLSPPSLPNEADLSATTYNVLLLSVSLFFIALDLISAALAWKGYRQLLVHSSSASQNTARAATFTGHPSSSTHVNIPHATAVYSTAMPSPSPVPIVVGYPYNTASGILNSGVSGGYAQPLNIVYVPTDAYNQSQTGRVVYQ